MPWSLARGCSRTGKLEPSTRSLSKENIALEKWNRLWQVRQLIIFRFWCSVSIFFQRYMCFSSVCCRWLIFSPIVYSVGCRQRLTYPARSDIMVGTVPSICTVVAAGEFCGVL